MSTSAAKVTSAGGLRWNFHTHSVWCDGRNTVSEMAKAAFEAGLEAFGFSGHGYCGFAEGYCMSRDAEVSYLKEIAAEKTRCQGQMHIYAGIELEGQDTRKFDRSLYDYCINSVHYIQANGKWFAVDESAQALQRCIDEGFAGDPYAMAEEFFRISAQTACQRKPDMIGHFDLLTKFNTQNCFFDENDLRYLSVAIEALREANKSGGIFEINSGAISRGIKGRIYPSQLLLEELHKIGGRVVISTDTHSIESINFGFDAMKERLLAAGFRETMCLTDQGWQERPL